MIMPPPSPVSEPSMPAANEPPTTRAARVSVVMAGNLAPSTASHKVVRPKRARHWPAIRLKAAGGPTERLIVTTIAMRSVRRAVWGGVLALTAFRMQEDPTSERRRKPKLDAAAAG